MSNEIIPATTGKKGTLQKESEQFIKEVGNVIFSSTIPSYLEIQKRLAEAIPFELVFEKERGGKSFPYMNITDCTDLLDERAGVWECSVISEGERGNEYMIVVEISILAAEGWIKRQDVGISTLNHSGYGDTSSNAYAMAFKRAASKHGLGRELWRKHDYFASIPADRAQVSQQRQRDISSERSNVTAKANSQAGASGKPTNPKATAPADLLSAKQMGLIRARAKELGKNAENFVNFQLGCNLDELRKRAASWVIDNIALLPDSELIPATIPTVATPVNIANPTTFNDDDPPANNGQIKALQVTIDNCLNKAGIDESFILAEFDVVGCRNTSFNNSGEYQTEGLTSVRAAALISKFNYFLKHGV